MGKLIKGELQENEKIGGNSGKIKIDNKNAGKK